MDGGPVEDTVIARLAGRQHGLVLRAQLLGAGVHPRTISRRLRLGRLFEVHRGVYAVGHLALTPRAYDLAAVLASGAGAALSHQSAAALWGLLPRPADGIHVTRVARLHGRPGIRVHRTQALASSDVRRVDGIPVTTPLRTLLDLAPAPNLERALNEALLRRLVTRPALLARAANRPGAAALRALLADEPTPTRSEAERRLLDLVRRAGLPLPQTNVRVGRWEVDALWRAERLVVEVDGYAFHSSRPAFERDRQRDADLQARGLRVIRITWRQLIQTPEAVIARIAPFLTLT